MAPKITSPSVPLKVTSPTMPNSVGWRRCSGEAPMLSSAIACPARPAHAADTSMEWMARDGGHRLHSARAVAASPDGARVYVTGISPRARTGEDAATVAYDAATEMRLWVSRYAGP